MTFETPLCLEDEWTTTYQPAHVDYPSVGYMGVDDLYDIIGR